MEQTVSYVLVPGDSGLSEQLFLEQQEQSMSKELEHRLERRLSPEDETRLPEEFNALIINATAPCVKPKGWSRSTPGMTWILNPSMSCRLWTSQSSPLIYPAAFLTEKSPRTSQLYLAE